VPVVKDIGLWGGKVQDAFRDMGVLALADTDAGELSRDDERAADRLDEERSSQAALAARQAEVQDTIRAGAT